jgi:hypothetical protein
MFLLEGVMNATLGTFGHALITPDLNVGLKVII